MPSQRIVVLLSSIATPSFFLDSPSEISISLFNRPSIRTSASSTADDGPQCHQHSQLGGGVVPSIFKVSIGNYMSSPACSRSQSKLETLSDQASLSVRPEASPTGSSGISSIAGRILDLRRKSIARAAYYLATISLFRRKKPRRRSARDDSDLCRLNKEVAGHEPGAPCA